MNESEVLLPEDQPIAAYDPFRAQLAELKESNSKIVFDYEDPKGNKDARSHVFQLRKTKTAVDNARKEAKKQSLEYGRKVDSEGNEIITQIESMIDVHNKPLKAIEQKEKDRKVEIEERFDEIVGIRQLVVSTFMSKLIAEHIDDLKKLEPDDSFDEYMAEATREHKLSMLFLQEALEIAKTAEAEKAELERLRQEQTAREQKEREEQIATEARLEAERKAEAQRIEVEEKAEADRIEAERKAESDRKAAKENEERIEREKQEALKREQAAIREATEAEERHKKEQKQAVIDAEARVQREAEEAVEVERVKAQKREANKKHRATINNKAVDCLVAGGIPKDMAKTVITIIAKKEVDYVSISY